MKNDSKFTTSRFATLTGADRHAITRRLAEMNARPVNTTGRGDEFSLRDLVAAASGGDMVAERLRKIRAEADTLEHGLKVRRREYLPTEEVKWFVGNGIMKIRTIIVTSPLAQREQDEILRQLHALKDHDWSKPPEDAIDEESAATPPSITGKGKSRRAVGLKSKKLRTS